MSMMGHSMRFPLIKVRSTDDGSEHILGTNSHDLLYLDPDFGGLQYMNLQNCEGTRKIPGGMSSYEFMVPSEEDNPFLSIEFISFEKLAEIYLAQVGLTAEREKKFREIMEKISEEEEKLEKEIEENTDKGIFHT